LSLFISRYQTLPQFLMQPHGVSIFNANVKANTRCLADTLAHVGEDVALFDS